MSKTDLFFYQDSANEWRWTLSVMVVGKREIIGAATEGYVDKADAIGNAETVGIALASAFGNLAANVADDPVTVRGK